MWLIVVTRLVITYIDTQALIANLQSHYKCSYIFQSGHHRADLTSYNNIKVIPPDYRGAANQQPAHYYPIILLSCNQPMVVESVMALMLHFICLYKLYFSNGKFVKNILTFKIT